MLTCPDLLYRLIATGFDRTVRRVEDLNILRISTLPNSHFTIEINRRSLLVSWAACANQTIESTERCTHALLCALLETHQILGRRAEIHRSIPRPGV